MEVHKLRRVGSKRLKEGRSLEVLALQFILLNNYYLSILIDIFEQPNLFLVPPDPCLFLFLLN